MGIHYCCNQGDRQLERTKWIEYLGEFIDSLQAAQVTIAIKRKTFTQQQNVYFNEVFNIH